MTDPSTKLAAHFTLREMCKSASHPEIYNVPPLEAVENLKRVCRWLEELRATYSRVYCDGVDTPLYVNSGYRSEKLNNAIKGAKGSNHLTGCAADIRCKSAEQALRYACILFDISTAWEERFDEIIIERRGMNFWVHFAVRPINNRCKVTVI